MLFKYNSHTLVSFYFLSEYCLWFLHHPGYRFCRIGETKITPSGGNTDRRAPPNVAHVSGCIYKVLRCKKGPSSFGQPPSTTDCHRSPHLLLRDGCTSIRPHIVYSNWLFHLFMPSDSSTLSIVRSGTNFCISFHSSQKFFFSISLLQSNSYIAALSSFPAANPGSKLGAGRSYHCILMVMSPHHAPPREPIPAGSSSFACAITVQSSILICQPPVALYIVPIPHPKRPPIAVNFPEPTILMLPLVPLFPN